MWKKLPMSKLWRFFWEETKLREERGTKRTGRTEMWVRRSRNQKSQDSFSRGCSLDVSQWLHPGMRTQARVLPRVHGGPDAAMVTCCFAKPIRYEVTVPSVLVYFPQQAGACLCTQRISRLVDFPCLVCMTCLWNIVVHYNVPEENVLLSAGTKGL